MSSLLLGGVLWILAAGPLQEAPTTDLYYSTQLGQLDRGGKSTPVHEFNMHVFVTRNGTDFTTRHVIEDAGNTLPWIGRFGQSSRAGTFPAIATVHRHDGLPYSLTVRVPFLNGAPKLAADTKWEEGQVDLEVTGTRKVGDWDCWVVESSDGLGRRGTFLVDQETGIVTSSTQRIFMGQGDRFELVTRLVSTNAVADASEARVAAIGESLRKLQAELGYAERTTDFELTAAQLESVADQIPALTEAAEGTAYERLVALINREVKAQQQRTTAVADLTKRFVGQAAPPIRVKTLTGTDYDIAPHKGKVIVLHFWDYRDSPLTEPYGQIGYLDFLASRRGERVKVIGVAVDPRLGSPDTAGLAVRSIRKLKEFMNVGYDITTDSGDLIKSFGDPRQFSAPLPLWVVIGPNGQIVHYRNGLYKVDVNRGLEELDLVVAAALKSAK
ncbi:peroxiredoxin family protein [Planctomyces sp. SH-PL14]|uniref:peroxiredoxin family protein n=1 Tax=Planctomyces sp. SH-PL14 TaxID=1632864 RepID=UPI00078DA05F|nr:redoxin domain-containing protein [Planctomyces sp. SH-PL14]AMV16540.1 AhpC/TSA family protein [Planctomyces sp. SH-PL14]